MGIKNIINTIKKPFVGVKKSYDKSWKKWEESPRYKRAKDNLKMGRI